MPVGILLHGQERKGSCLLLLTACLRASYRPWTSCRTTSVPGSMDVGTRSHGSTGWLLAGKAIMEDRPSPKRSTKLPTAERTSRGSPLVIAALNLPPELTWALSLEQNAGRSSYSALVLHKMAHVKSSRSHGAKARSMASSHAMGKSSCRHESANSSTIRPRRFHNHM